LPSSPRRKSLAAPRRYCEELRERATRMAIEAILFADPGRRDQEVADHLTLAPDVAELLESG
jgi:hypothetical protein